MTRRRALSMLALSMLVGLALGLGLGVRRSSSGLPEDDIEILDEPSASEKIDLERPFGTPFCYDRRDWRDLATVTGYVRRLLGAEPEGGMLSRGVYWAESRPVEILASVEFSTGQRRPLQLANGYAHVQDGSGCEWWGRYLGPDRSQWVVRP